MKKQIYKEDEGMRGGDESRDGAVVRALASHRCDLVLILGNMRVEFVVGSRPCSEDVSPGFSGFPPSTKTNSVLIHVCLQNEFLSSLELSG